MVKRYLSKKEAALELGISASTLQRWITKGQLPVIKLPSTTDGGGNGVVRIDREDIDRLMLAHKIDGDDGDDDPNGGAS